MFKALRSLFSAAPARPQLRFLALMRHAHALPADADQPDADRELSDLGHAACRAQGAWLAATLDQALEAAFVSPAQRAQQTYAGVLETAAALLPDAPECPALLYDDPHEFLQSLQQAPVSSALVVTHNPGLGLWLAETVGGSPAMQRELLDIDPGDVALLCHDEGAWHLVQLHRAPTAQRGEAG